MDMDMDGKFHIHGKPANYPSRIVFSYIAIEFWSNWKFDPPTPKTPP